MDGADDLAAERVDVQAGAQVLGEVDQLADQPLRVQVGHHRVGLGLQAVVQECPDQTQTEPGDRPGEHVESLSWVVSRSHNNAAITTAAELRRQGLDHGRMPPRRTPATNGGMARASNRIDWLLADRETTDRSDQGGLYDRAHREQRESRAPLGEYAVDPDQGKRENGEQAARVAHHQRGPGQRQYGEEPRGRRDAQGLGRSHAVHTSALRPGYWRTWQVQRGGIAWRRSAGPMSVRATSTQRSGCHWRATTPGARRVSPPCCP